MGGWYISLVKGRSLQGRAPRADGWCWLGEGGELAPCLAGMEGSWLCPSGRPGTYRTWVRPKDGKRPSNMSERACVGVAWRERLLIAVRRQALWTAGGPPAHHGGDPGGWHASKLPRSACPPKATCDLTPFVCSQQVTPPRARRHAICDEPLAQVRMKQWPGLFHEGFVAERRMQTA